MKTQLIVLLAIALAPFILNAQTQPRSLTRALEAIEDFSEKNPRFNSFVEDAYGYVVFPSIGAGAYGIGGALGTGTVFERGKVIGKAKISKLTVGLQFGGQAYRQIIFFETESDLERFKQNKFEVAAQASAIAVKTGTAVNLKYNDGVKVFTMSKAGFMYEAAIGAQKLKFKPLE